MHKSQQGTGNNFAIKAFEANELARGRSLAEMLKATGTNLLPGLDADLAAQEKSLRQRLRSKEDLKIRLLTNGAKKEELDALEQEVAKLEDEYKQLSDVIKARFPAFDEITRPHGWDLKRIQQQVIADDQTLLLEYNLGEKSSYAWTVTRDGFASYELPGGAKQINDAAQRVYELLQSGDTKQNEWEQATAALSKMVLLPVKNSLNKQRIIVVADGALNYIPFQSLPPSPNNSEPLVAKFEVVNAPSASVLGQLRQETDRRQQRPQLLAAYGDAAFPSDFAQRKESNGDHIASLQAAPTDRWRHALRDIELKGDKFDPSSLQRLVYAELEVNNLRKVTGAGSLIATGFDASREKLLSTDLTRFSILHFATHGIFDPKRPEYSGLFLSMIDRDGKDQNGFLGLQDIYNLHAPVDLVVLSACRTGLGKDVRGEGLIGLTRGFMYAGASSVVASLWKVDDEATAELMKEFYTNMVVRQLTPAASLREAQNTIRKRPEWSSPHFWAAFTIQGEYNKVIKPAPSSHFPIYVATLSVLILGSSALLYYRRKRTARDRYSTVKK
jgi:CHAT domain-containing protein